jgi:hypothetical protein
LFSGWLEEPGAAVELLPLEPYQKKIKIKIKIIDHKIKKKFHLTPLIFHCFCKHSLKVEKFSIQCIKLLKISMSPILLSFGVKLDKI